MNQEVEDELLVLESIYPDQLSRDDADRSIVTIRVDINLDEPSRIVCQQVIEEPSYHQTISTINPATKPVSETPASIVITSGVLPSLLVTLRLAPEYPQQHHEVKIIRTWSTQGESECWLPAFIEDRVRTELKIRFDEDVEHQGVLWSWLDWIASGAFLHGNTEGIVQKDGTYTILTTTPSNLHTAIRAQLIHTRQVEFSATSFTCGICFESKKGRACISLPCSLACVFCTECLEACWGLAIREGSISGVACPGFDCIKARVKAEGAEEEDVNQELLMKVVGQELTERYVWLKEKKKVENDPTYTLCPLQHCQAPVPPPPKSSGKPTKVARVFRLHAQLEPKLDPKTGSPPAQITASEDYNDRFRQCPSCQFSFCRYCSNTWHGTAACPLPSTASFLQKYMASEGAERLGFERRYGRKQLARMVEEWEEQEANKDWFDKFTRACPGCQTRVNKSAGCNHMTCSKCQAHFCYRCGTKLRPADPYHHYRTPGSSCFEKLFDADEIARFEREAAGGGEDLGMAEDWVNDAFPMLGNGWW